MNDKASCSHLITKWSFNSNLLGKTAQYVWKMKEASVCVSYPWSSERSICWSPGCCVAEKESLRDSKEEAWRYSGDCALEEERKRGEKRTRRNERVRKKRRGHKKEGCVSKWKVSTFLKRWVHVIIQ